MIYLDQIDKLKKKIEYMDFEMKQKSDQCIGYIDMI